MTENKWQHIPLDVISFSERIHYDGLVNPIMVRWANDSFAMRGVTFDTKQGFWKLKKVCQTHKL